MENLGVPVNKNLPNNDTSRRTPYEAFLGHGVPILAVLLVQGLSHLLHLPHIGLAARRIKQHYVI